MAFSSDAKTALTGSDDGTARLWNVAELPDDFPRIASWVVVTTGLELRDRGRVGVLDNTAWRHWLERLEETGGARSRP